MTARIGSSSRTGANGASRRVATGREAAGRRSAAGSKARQLRSLNAILGGDATHDVSVGTEEDSHIPGVPPLPHPQPRHEPLARETGESTRHIPIVVVDEVERERESGPGPSDTAMRGDLTDGYLEARLPECREQLGSVLRRQARPQRDTRRSSRRRLRAPGGPGRLESLAQARTSKVEGFARTIGISAVMYAPPVQPRHQAEALMYQAVVSAAEHARSEVRIGA